MSEEVQLVDLGERYLAEVEVSEKSSAVIAVQLLIQYLRQISSSAATLSEVFKLLDNAVTRLKEVVAYSDRCLDSGCQIFLRHVTRLGGSLPVDELSLEQIVQQLLSLGEQYLHKIERSRLDIAKYASGVLRKRWRVLTHGRSRAVLAALVESKAKRLTVLVTSSGGDGAAERMVGDLRAAGVSADLIDHAAVGFHLENIDAVCVGAESVCQSGGVINRVGTLSIALCAKLYGTPLYVLAESYKFTQLFPLSNSDIPLPPPQRRRGHSNPGAVEDVIASDGIGRSIASEGIATHPCVDYTEPNLITYVVSDLGILTPETVCEQLLRLYE